MPNFEIQGLTKEEVNRSFREIAKSVNALSGEGGAPDFKGRRLRNVGEPKEMSDAIRKTEHQDHEQRIGKLETVVAQSSRSGVRKSQVVDILDLSQTISATPTQAEVLAIQNKLNELLRCLRGDF